MTSEERHAKRRERRKTQREDRYKLLAAKHDDVRRVADANHLLTSAKRARKGVRFKASVQKYFANILYNVFKAKRKILNGDDVRMGFIEFTLRERGKTRHIRAMRFAERVIQCCLCTYVLVPYLLRSCVYDNGASQKGKGIHFALRRCEHHIKEFYKKYGTDGYVLLIDFTGYFDNIEHAHIFEIIEHKFKDEKLKLLITRFIEAFGNKSLGIGSQVSQVFAVLYASGVDHYIREVLHIGLSARYMDDSYLMHPDKAYLRDIVLPLLAERYKKLGIVINLKKTHIERTSDFKFLKVRFKRTGTGKVLKLPDNRAFVRQRRKLRKLQKLHERGEIQIEDIRAEYQSFYGYYQHLDCKRQLYAMDKTYFELFGEWPKHGKKNKKKHFSVTRETKKLFRKVRKRNENRNLSKPDHRCD